MACSLRRICCFDTTHPKLTFLLCRLLVFVSRAERCNVGAMVAAAKRVWLRREIKPAGGLLAPPFPSGSSSAKVNRDGN